MEAKELRIGNYVEGIGMEHPIRKIYDSIQYNYKTERYELDDIDIQYFKPIPLTEEWFIKFGFEYDDVVTGENRTEKGMFKGFLMMLTHPNGKLWYACPYGYPINPHRTIYVHQLQNLYFALTGEELKSKD